MYQSKPAAPPPPKTLSSLSAAAAPIARREPTPTNLHGHTLDDDYRWMRDKDSAEVIEYLEAENAYTSAQMKGTEELQEKLYREMLSHIKETDESVPFAIADGSTTPAPSKEASTPFTAVARLSVRLMTPRSPNQVILDVNQLAEGQAFMAVGGMSVSPDGDKLGLLDRQYRLPPIHPPYPQSCHWRRAS